MHSNVVDTSHQTIQQLEESLQAALQALQASSASTSTLTILKLLAPEGYVPVVELHQEDGRRKRRTASADNWNPETGEIRIYFDREQPSFRKAMPQPTSVSQPTSQGQVLPGPIRELCDALEEVEREGRAFIALKWFRDDVLVSKSFAWARTPEERQRVLAQAIQESLVLTSRIPNPHSPLYPTTTLRLNRERHGNFNETARTRFRPISVKGEPVSATILRERGAR